MSNLNDQQFAQYSAVRVFHGQDEDIEPLPASMERHAPGEYQPTLPGMENMLPHEQTHTEVFFPKGRPESDEWGDPHGSDWSPKKKAAERVTENVNPRELHTMQDWVDDDNLQADHFGATPVRSRPREWKHRPMVEKIGNQRVIQDGHHRAARAILNGAPQIEVNRWNGG